MNLRSAVYAGLLLSLIVISGCATTGAKTGYLQNYDELKRGSFLHGFHLNPKASSLPISTIRVGEIDTSKTPGAVTYTPAQASTDLKGALQTAVQRYGQIDRYKFDPSAQADATLELAITEINPGSRAGRFFAAEFGAGHAYVQVEGKLMNTSTSEELASFSEKRRSSGLAGTLDTFEDAGPTLMKQMLSGIAADIVQELKSV